MPPASMPGPPARPAEALTDHQAPYVPTGLPPSHSASASVVATALIGHPRRRPRSRARSMPPATMLGPPARPAVALTDHQASYVPPGAPPSGSAGAVVVATALTGHPRRRPRSRARSMPSATMPGPPARPAEALTDHQAP